MWALVTMRVGAAHEGVRRQRRVEAEVRRPGGVDQQRDAVRVCRRRDGGQVAGRAHVGRVTDEDRPQVAVAVELPAHLPRGDAGRQPGGGVHVRAQPDRLQPGEHQAEQERAVQGPGYGDPVARLPHGERQRLVAVGRAADREAADVGAPQPGRAALGVGEDAVLLLHRVQPAEERHVARHHPADEIGPSFVAGNGERSLSLVEKGQVGVEQRRVRAQPLLGGPGHPQRLRKPRSRRLLETTNTDDSAIAAPAIIGLSSPAAASGRAATL